MVSGIGLNSPGGALLEAVKIADVIRYCKIATVVPNGQTCASACFIIFAAGGEKYASYRLPLAYTVHLTRVRLRAASARRRPFVRSAAAAAIRSERSRSA